jgi:hypothetical protein
VIRKPPPRLGKPGKLRGEKVLLRILDPSYPDENYWFTFFEYCIELFVKDPAAATLENTTYDGKNAIEYLDRFRAEVWSTRKQIGAVNLPGAARTELLSAFSVIDSALGRLRAALKYPVDDSTVEAVRAAALAIGKQSDRIVEATRKLHP